MKKIIRLLCVVCSLVTLSIPLIGGCGSSTTATTETEDDDNVKDGVGICFGRVIDRSTRAGISGATVEIFAGAILSSATNASDPDGAETNFVAVTTTASDDADTTLFDESGMWRVANLPTGEGTGYRVRVGVSGYATVQTLCSFAVATADNTPIAEDLGDIMLAKAASATVNVVSALTGGAISSCTVYALPSTSGEPAGTGSQSTSVLSGVEVVATTDSSGVATLSGLDPFLDYSIIVPACDANADGVYDYQTSVATLDERIDTNTTFTTAVAPAEADDTPALVASNCTQFSPTEDQTFGAEMPGCGVPTNGLSLVFAFNYPIQNLATGALSLLLNPEATFTTSSVVGGILGGAAVDFDGDDQTATDFGIDTAFTGTLSAGNTILAVTPSAALATNGLYTLDGAITASVPGASAVGNIISQDFGTLLGTLMGNELIYVFPASDASITNPTADNYNSDDDNAAASAVCLEFDEIVVGSAQVTARTAAGTAATIVPVGVDLSLGSLINEGDNAAFVCGGGEGCPSSTDATCTAAATDSDAIKYVVPIGGGVTLADQTAAAANNITVFVDALDYAGNQLQTELTLEIQ